ncbi:MAG: hypothetical protein GF411_05400 [Candidatus Lokiarchaeota archaeon]|nr:hypothetical protein [Candidatus Lokiarchaeota archaeon]
MHLRARITIIFRRTNDAEIVRQSTDPDNNPIPEGLDFQSWVEENELVIEIQSNKGINSLSATAEDFLSSVDLIIRVSEDFDKGLQSPLN